MEENFINDLKSLLSLDYAAVEAYEAAIEKFANEKYKKEFQHFKNDHNSHIQEISTFLDKNNYDHPTSGGIKTLLTAGKVVLAQLVGDITILKAMRSNERETTKAYENINQHKDIPLEIKKTLLKGYEDEKRHLEWIEKELMNEK